MKLWEKVTHDSGGRGYSIGSDLKLRNISPRRILDVACGNGKVLMELKEIFPHAQTLGIDIEEFAEWKENPESFRKIPLQSFISKEEGHWDVVLMLNSYRNWKGKDKEAFDNWIHYHVTSFITSMTADYIGKDTHGFPMLLFRI